MPPNQQNQQATNTNAFQELCFFPALTVMVFMRRRIGLRMLKPTRLIGAFVLLYLYSGFGVALLGGTYKDMQAVQYFAVAFAILAIAHYWRSWREFNRGIRLHSYSSGISHLEVQNRLPRFFKSHRRIYRMVDPFFCLIISFYVMVLSHPLGLWIAVSSFSLRIFEQARYEAALTRDLDIVDSLPPTRNVISVTVKSLLSWWLEVRKLPFPKLYPQRRLPGWSRIIGPSCGLVAMDKAAPE